MTERKRIIYLDIARTIAIVSITFNHAVNRSFNIDSNQYEEFISIPLFVSIIKVILYSFSRIGVPLFLMISGALLIGRDYSGGEGSRFIKRNWLQLLVTTEIWLTIMFWYKQIGEGSVLATEGVVTCLIRFVMTLLFLNPVTMGSMWYMQMILCVYLIIPIMSSALKQISAKILIIPMTMVAFCSFILPDINGFVGAIGLTKTIETKLESSNIFSMYLLIVLIGYFIHIGLLRKLKTSMLTIVLIVSFVSFCLFQLWFYSIDYDFVVGQHYSSIFPLVVAAAMFELLRRTEVKRRIVIVITKYISLISFGIYFVHICIMEGMRSVINHMGLDISNLFMFVLLEGVSFGGAVIIIELTRKNKWIAKNLFGIK